MRDLASYLFKFSAFKGLVVLANYLLVVRLGVRY